MAPSLVKTLLELAEQGYKFAFVSNNPIQRGLAAMRYAANSKGEELAKLFSTAFFEAGDIQKPKPDVYLKAMQKLDTSQEFCSTVEDSVTGMKSAVSAGIRTFGFLGFSSNIEEASKKLLEIGAVKCFNDWQELPQILIDQNDIAPLGATDNHTDFS